MLKKIIVLFSILILVLLSWIYSNFIFIKPSNYDRELYSVVIYNSTNDNLKNVIISYYKFDEKPEEFTCVSNISSGEYRKINIPTDIQKIGSYNVNVMINAFDKSYNFPAGYFGTRAGGFTIVKIIEKDGELETESIPQDTREYKKLYRRHLKNQQERNWY